MKIVPNTEKLTSKIISSCIRQCFGPLGNVAPIVRIGKLCLSYAWRLQLKLWDANIGKYKPKSDKEVNIKRT